MVDVTDGDGSDDDATSADRADGDRLLNVLGVVLALFIVVGIVGVVLAGLSGPSTDVEDAPDADWELERVNDSHVRLTHGGGDVVPATDLVVTVDGVRRRVSWSGNVVEGDAGTVRADRGMIVELFWTNDVGERIKLESWRV
jgi:hypothetical protein